MAENRPSGEHEAHDDVFRRLETLLTELRATASAPPEPESWAKRAFGPASAHSRQSELNIALIGALTETLNFLRGIATNEETQETRLEKIATELSEMRALFENLDAFRERSDRLETELRTTARNVKGLQERAAGFESELAKAREELSAQGQKLSDEARAGIRGLGDETRERIQHLLDEQRVSIRQLALQASEEATLADRARRATELKLEELSRRLAPPPA